MKNFLRQTGPGLLLSLLLFAGLCGCGRKRYLDDFTDAGNTANVNMTVATDRFTFLGETSRRFASNGQGIYYMIGIERKQDYNIFYYDFAAGRSQIWCSQLDCRHNSSVCTGYLDRECQYEFIECCGGKVYKIVYDDNGIYLEQFDRDGSNQMRLVNLMPEETQVVQFKAGKFYENRFYYTILNDQGEAIFYEIPLQKNAAAKRLFVVPGEKDRYIAPSTVFINAEGIYFTQKQTDPESQAAVRMIWRYDFADSSLNRIETGAYTSMCANDMLYYRGEDAMLYQVDSAGRTQRIENEQIGEIGKDYTILCNEKYIVFDNAMKSMIEGIQRGIFVYDIAQNTLREVDTNMLFGRDEENNDGTVAIEQLRKAFPIGMDAAYYYVYGGSNQSTVFMIRLASSDQEKPYDVFEMTSAE